MSGLTLEDNNEQCGQECTAIGVTSQVHLILLTFREGYLRILHKDIEKETITYLNNSPLMWESIDILVS